MPTDSFEQDRRQRTRDQIGLIREARGERGLAWDSTDEADFSYLYDPGAILVRPGADQEAINAALADNQDEFAPPIQPLETEIVIDGLMRMELPQRRQFGRADVPFTLDYLDQNVRFGVAAPDHYLHITSNASCCPATEPAETGLTEPWPPVSSDPDAGAGVRILVIDTGLDQRAATDPRTPWLADVGGVVEPNGATLEPYAGHGTFAAGVIRCRAPKADVWVARFLVKPDGTILESELARLLSAALDQEDPYDVISMSAGTYTRYNSPLLSFQVLWDNKLRDRPDTVVVAAAGNDSLSDPFYPAAFGWAVGVGSLDRGGMISSYSNYGTSADVYAVGRNHVNAFPDGRYECHETPDIGDVREFTTGLARWSGTSFSTPLVAGMIAAGIAPGGRRSSTSGAARTSVLGGAVNRQDALKGSYRALLPPY